MKRSILACLVALMAVPAALLQAQTPVVTPAPFTLPVNLLLLRIREGNGYEYMTDSAGQLVYGNVSVIRDGAMPEGIPAGPQALYTDLGVQEMYYSYVALVPTASPGEPEMPGGIAIETRLTRVQDGGSAARLVAVFPDILAEEAPDDAGNITAMKDPPIHDQAIIGVTGRDASLDIAGEPSSGPAPYTQIIVQHGTTVASVRITSLDPVFNDAVARELLAAQVQCLEDGMFCVPVPLPERPVYAPGTSTSPLASAPSVRRS